MSDKDEALRLADALTECHHIGVGGPDLQAAACLRRQHAEIESLKAERDEDRRREYGYSQQTVDALKKECDALRADAERYRWLRECARATSEHWGGRWSLVIEGPAPGGNAPPASIDAAIDAAREGK